MKIVSKSLIETQKFVQEFLEGLKPKSSNLKATVLLLEGDLGSGKTTFTQFLAKELGVKNHLTSPTFVLIKKYEIPLLGISPCVALAKRGDFKKLIHIDAYRLNKGEELLALGWEELISEPTNLIVVEWPERVADLWTGKEQKISFKFIDENAREIKI